MSLLQREWRRGLVLEPRGTLEMTRTNAAAGEGEETLTGMRLEADARPTDADEGEAIVDVDNRGADSESLRGGGLLMLRYFSWSGLLGVTPL